MRIKRQSGTVLVASGCAFGFGFGFAFGFAFSFASAFSIEALAQPAPSGPRIISCRDAKGRPIKTDRLVLCASKARELNADGSVRSEIPSPLSPEEMAQQQECEGQNRELLSAQREKERRDRNLIVKFPDEATHGQAREKGLDDVRFAVKVTQNRIAHLVSERKPLLEEAEFYKGKPLPPGLKQKLDTNAGLLEVQKALAQNQQAEAGRINAGFDEQLAYLRQAWARTKPPPAPIHDCTMDGMNRTQ